MLHVGAGPGHFVQGAERQAAAGQVLVQDAMAGGQDRAGLRAFRGVAAVPLNAYG